MSERTNKQWYIVKFSSGAVEIIPSTWIDGDEVFWPPLNPKDTNKLHSVIRNREQPRPGWQIHKPVKVLSSHGDHAEANKWLSRYLSGDCDTTDIQSEDECTPQLKRARRPNPRYYSESDSGETQERLPQAPRILYPASSSPKTYETLQFGCLSEDLFQKSSVSGTFMEEFQSQSLLASPTGMQLPQESSPAVADSRDNAQQALKDVAMRRLLTAVSELTKEVRDLRQEFREFHQSCRCGQAVAPVGPQLGVPFGLPLCNLEALDQAEAALQTEDNQGAMTVLLAKIGGTTVELKIRRMLAWTLTNELASEINWAGKKNKDPSKQKRPFRELALSKCMFDALVLEGGTATQFEFAQVVQKWLRYAPDRAGGTGRSKLPMQPTS